MGDKTLGEVFTCVKLNVGHLRIFGYPIYFHVLKEKSNKLEAFGKKGMFVGYYENYKSYIIYVSGQTNVDFIRDVTFDEDVFLEKERDTPLPTNVEKKDDVMDV